MARTDKQQSYYDAESDAYIAAVGLPDDRKLWSVTSRELYIQHMARYILANPQIFSDEDLERSETAKSIDFGDAVDYGIIEAFGDFGSEFIDQSERVNPFSDFNLGKTYIIGGIVVVVGIAVIAWRATPDLTEILKK
jgi:hypothetical protein